MNIVINKYNCTPRKYLFLFAIIPFPFIMMICLTSVRLKIFQSIKSYRFPGNGESQSE